MAEIPDGAQRSEDGQWWWDETQQQWQPVAESTSSAGTPAPGDDASSVTYAEAQAQGSGGEETNLSDDEIAAILERAGATEPGVA